MPALMDKLKKIHKDLKEPLWKGPSSDDPNGGITQSMLQQFLICRERFRIKYVLGLQPIDRFNKALEYGNMWHACEEGLAAEDKDLYERLDTYVGDLCAKYPLEQKEIIHWYNLCKIQFPPYVDWWAEHDDVQDRVPLLEEECFDVQYQVPSGRMVRLRGKFDSVDSVSKQIWLQENKSKGNIDQPGIQRNLTFDLQTGMYMTALKLHQIQNDNIPHEQPLSGIRYNVVRRPLSGGKGTVRQKKKQSLEKFYEEVEGIIKGAYGPEWDTDGHFFFMRWNVPYSAEDIATFGNQFLDPIFEQLLDWWDWITGDDDPFASDDAVGNSIHWKTPYGLYSPLYGAQGSLGEVEEYLESGSMVGMHRAESLFRELD